MPSLIDLTGKRFGRLSVLSRYGDLEKPCGKKEILYMCVCDCKKQLIVRGNALRTGNTKSCGCLRIDSNKRKTTIHGAKHDGEVDRLYRIWKGMKTRTTNPNSYGYRYYGERGIHICNEWFSSYISFRDWAISNGYRDDLSIDRIDNDGNYEPSNCRWVTKQQQYENRRVTKKEAR